MRLLIDGDILVYSVANACEKRWYEIEDPETGFIQVYKGKKDIKKQYPKMDIADLQPERNCLGEGMAVTMTKSVLNGWLRRIGSSDNTMYLTHPDINKNFRKVICPEYKENRKGLLKPLLYQFMRDHLVDTYGAEIAVGYEADDALGIAQDEGTIIVSKDKDLLQVPGEHFNTMSKKRTSATKSGSLTLRRYSTGKGEPKVSLTGHGFKFFCAQMLLGDTVDNIKGIKGMGPVKIHKLLSKLRCREKMWEAVLKVYKEKEREDYLKNAQLLWILREEGQYFNEDLI